MQPTTMYGCNKLYCEQLGTLLRAALQAAGGGAGERAGRLPLRAVSRADLGGDDAVGRHVGLRAGDDPRGGERGAVRCFVRPDTRIPFMAMPDGVEALLTLAAAPRERPDADRLQRRRVQPVGASEIRDVVARGVPDGADRLARRTRSGRASSTRGRRTSTTARRVATGASIAAARLRARVLGLPDPADPRTVSAREREATDSREVQGSQTPERLKPEPFSRPDRRRVDLGERRGAGIGRPLPVEARDGADGHVVVADDLARQPHAG